MNYCESSHKQNWIFSSYELERLRGQEYDEAKKRVENLWSLEHGSLCTWRPLSKEEDRELQCLYQHKALQLCKSVLQQPSKVSATAVVIMKRFGIKGTMFEYDVIKLMLTAIYVSCKVEESYLGVERLVSLLDLPPGYSRSVLDFEVQLLQAIRFEMVIHSHLRILTGLIPRLLKWLAEGGGAKSLKKMEASLPKGGSKRIGEGAWQFGEDLLISDAPLLYSPGVLAFCAALVGLEGIFGADAAERLGTAFLREKGANAGFDLSAANEHSPARCLEDLRRLVDATPKFTDARMKELQERSQSSRSPYLNPKSSLSKAARERREKRKQAP